MAKFVMDEEGRYTMSGDKFTLLQAQGKLPEFDKPNKSKVEYSKLIIPNGRCNEFKLNNVNMHDLLQQIQHNITSECVIKSIIGHNRECLHKNDIITKRISELVQGKITNKVRNMCPRIKDESDEEYEERLMYWYAEMFYSKQLKEIRCSECIRHWLRSNDL